MIRTVAACHAIVLGALVATAAPAPKEKGDLYHPTQVGDKRVYEHKGVGGRARDESSNVITKVERKDDVFIVTTGREVKGKMRDTGTHEVSDKGVTTTATTFGKLKTPRPVIKLPAKEGDKWEYESEGDGPAGAKSTFTVGKEEEVEVPAGKFKAIRIDAELNYDIGNGPTTIKTSSWYAPKVGLIKMVTNPGTTETVMVLKSFTPGK
jgi:hypothetical protein